MADLLLGGPVDPATHQRGDATTVIDSGDLTTHGVIVGMTGSGKTGLGVVAIEECLSAGIPALVIDPKGDLTNLCLTFPNLAAEDFRPWVNDGDARTAGVSVDAFAAQQATQWKDGLATWGIGPERIAALRAAVTFTIYTPGSSAGVGVNIIGSLRAPSGTNDAEAVADEVEGFVSGLLSLAGIEADPLASREHILLSNLIGSEWAAGRSLDLPALVGMVQQPPIRKLGVFELDAFFPPAERTAFAMRLNGLLASPSFGAWMSGPPLDIDIMLRAAGGSTRCAIVTTAHLSDEERQFVTTLVLAKLVTWMRRQSGTTDLRALLYMDEVAGYLPPTASPPTKKPIMTLMKQARAFGVGVVLATQNPVDIDYKALSNAGTWMIGRLQTERDKQRLLDGMSAASGGVDVTAVGDTIGGLAKREFVLRRAGKDTPEVFTTRWAMSYLRGPLTRDQIATLMADQRTSQAQPGVVADSTDAAPPRTGDDETTVMPDVAPGVVVRWADVAAPWLTTIGGDPRGAAYSASVVARVALRYDDTAADLVHDEEYEAVLHPIGTAIDATAAVAVDYDDRDLRAEVPPGCVYRLPDAPINQKSFWSEVERGLVDALARSQSLQVHTNRALKLFSRPDETAEGFTARCAAAADAKADEETAKLRDKYETKTRAVERQLHAAEDRAQVLSTESKGRQKEEILSTAGSILGGLLGGRSRKSMMGSVLGKLGSAAGRRTRSAASATRVDAARNKVEELHGQLTDIEADLAADLQEIDSKWSAVAADTSTVPVALERSDVKVTQIVLAWIPVA